MKTWRIIVVTVLLAGCQPWAPARQGPPPPVIVEEYPATGQGPIIVPQPPAQAAAPGAIPGPPFFPPSQVIVPQSPEIVTVLPPQSTVVPLPSHTPGSIFGPPMPQPGAPTAPPASPLANIAPGGMISPQLGLPPGPEAMVPLASSISVPVTNDEWAWYQITDVVGDYFQITSERRASDAGSEGRIDTVWQDGATWLEPHRQDSVGRFNRWESTFQTIRRRAEVRVIPDGVGYTIELAVHKEMEDLPHPERATAGAATFRNDGSLPSGREEPVSRTRSSPRWIALGRDPPLEQRMLAEIHARLSGVATGSAPLFAR